MPNILSDPSLIEHWNCDEEGGARVGASGSHNLSESGQVASEPGKLGLAAQFDAGSTDQLSCSSPEIANFKPGEFSLSLWFKYHGQSQMAVLATGFQSMTQIAIAGGSLYAFCNGIFAVHGKAITEGEWHHIAMSSAAVEPASASEPGTTEPAAGSGGESEGDNVRIRVVVDGEAVHDGEGWSESTGNAFEAFQIGGFGANPMLSLNGAIDHVSFFGRALSTEELQELYGNGTPPEFE